MLVSAPSEGTSNLADRVTGRPLRIVLVTFYNYESHAIRIFHPLLTQRGHDVHSIFFKNYFTYQVPTQLEEDMVRMGAVVEEMVDKAVRALVERDVDLANEVINEDDLADSLDLHIEQRCMRLLALQQPMSKDLRTIGSILKAITDLERIGGFSVDIAHATHRIAEQPVSFNPRSRAAGKKIGWRDGFAAIQVLVRHRFSA